MKALTLARTFSILAIVSSAAISCQKSLNPVSPGSVPQNTPTQTALMNATNDVVQSGTVQDETQTDVLDLKGADSSSCRTVTYLPSKNVYPNQKTVDFGSGCLGADGITRSGEKIIEDYANPDSAWVGAKISQTTFKDFYEDSIRVEGTITLYKKQAASAGALVLEYVENLTLTAPNGTVKSSYGTHDWTQIAGANTATKEDDVFKITGSSKGSEILDGATLLNFTATVDDLHPLIKPLDCYFRTMGQDDVQIHIVSGGGANFSEVLDYGNGDCDNIATISINGGMPQQVTLPLQFWPLSL